MRNKVKITIEPVIILKILNFGYKIFFNSKKKIFYIFLQLYNSIKSII
jgi:hypothetical protein